MANATIKITQLPSIGNGLTASTILPVVNTTGTATTDKVAIGNIANFILTQAGNTLPPAFVSNLAYSVANAAQPNITSVGNLTGLTLTNLANFHIPGGTNGYVLQTNGNGNLSWVTQSGVPGGSNTQVQFNDGGVFGGNTGLTYNKTNTTLTANNFVATTTANLGAVGNVKITGGSNGQVLTTFGNGTLSWTSPASNSLVNGNSNVIVTANSNVSISASGNANVVTVTGNALYVSSTLDSTGGSSGSIGTEGGLGVQGNIFGNSRLYVGAFSNATNLLSPVAVFKGAGPSYVQVAALNTLDTGSADLVTYGDNGNDTFGWADMGFTGSNFADANYTITGSNDGYLFAQAQAGKGGNLVIATGGLGTVKDIIFATSGFLVANEFARMSHSNNSLELTRANASITFPDGSIQDTAYTGGAVSELVNGDNSFVLDNDGNVVFEGDGAGQAVDRGLVWDYGANANGVNSQIRQDLNGLTVRAWTENGGNYIAPVNIITGQDANTNTWRFDGQGNLTVPSGSINSINDGGDIGAYLTLTPNIGLVRLTGREAQSSVNYTNTAWTSATYTGTQIDFVDSPQLVDFFNTNRFNVGVNQTISINGDEPIPFTGYTTSVGNAVIVYTSVTADPDPTTVTSIDFSSQSESYFAVDYDGGELVIGATGLTIMIDNDQTEGPDINIRSGDDITLQAKDTSIGSEREGGDINILAGDGADDDGQGNTASTGGDIQITAGNGGDGNTNTGSAGGFTQIYGGTGGAAGVSSTAGPGGYVSINGGDGGYDTGNTQLGAGGGYVSINAGLSTQEGVNGPNVTITSGQGGPNALAGSVVISTPASVDGPGGNWIFDGNGNLTIPNGGNINFVNTGGITQAVNEDLKFTVSDDEEDGWAIQSIVNDGAGNNLTQMQVRYDGVRINTDLPANNYSWDFRDSGEFDVPKSIRGPVGGNLVISIGDQSGSNTFIDLQTRSYVGDALISNIRIANPNVTVSTASGAYNWTFGDTGNLTLPGNTFAVNYANGTQVSIGGGSGNTGNVTFDDVTVQGVNGLNLSAGSDFTANLAYLQVRAGDVASHIHLDTGNNSAYDLIVGDDQNYVQVSSTGNILLSAYDSNTAQYTWTLDYNGNLILAGGNSVIQSIANSSLDILNPNVSTMVLTPDQGYSSQALVLDPTAPGHIHLRAPSQSGNIDIPAANIFLGGEDTSFEITVGANNYAMIHSGGNTWTFATDGNLTLPGEGIIQSINDTVILQSMDANSNVYSARLGTNGGLYFATTQYPQGWLDITNNSGNANITAASGTAGGAGKHIYINAGAADQSDFYTTAGGNINITGGLGASNDGGGGGPGGSVNITSGNSSDPAGHNGNVTINTGGSNTWTFDYNGNLTIPGSLIAITASPSPTINGFSITNSMGISGNGNISTAGTITATGKIGYSTGGNATQTSTGQGVTINQLTGLVTLANRTYNAGDLEAFSISCNKVSNNDFVLVQMVDSVNAPSYNVVAYPNFVLANTISVLVKTLETVGTDTPILKFMIVKAPIA